MGHPYEPADGIAGFLAGTPQILGLVAIRSGVELLAEAGIDAIAAKGRALTAYAVELHDELLAPLGVQLGTPRDPAKRGAHVSFRHPEAWRICRALIERADVVPGLPRPRQRPLRLPAALHTLRRRPRGRSSASGASSSARSTSRSTPRSHG